jgi:glycerol-3-phosphate acyltransferase PlsX
MKILIDAMSGDNAPLEILKGVELAKSEFPTHELILVGDENVISDIAVKNDLSLAGIKIIPAASVITMEDSPLSAVRDKRDSSMSVGFKTLSKGEVVAFVSAGNTGALVTGATIIVRRIPGINRAAIASILPLSSPVLLMDSGANLTVSSDNIIQFAFMGAKYMEKIYGIDRPRIGQLNNGTEYNKGNALQTESYQLLSESGLNFVGNVEAKDIAFGVCDVVVTDGFTGNIILKLTEGMAWNIFKTIKKKFTDGLHARLGSLLLLDKLKELKKEFDYSSYGGAPILGIKRPVVKMHGSSSSNGVKNTILKALVFAEQDVIGVIEDSIQEK